MLIGVLVVAIFIPVQSFGETLDSIRLFLHESASDSSSKPSLERQEQPMALVTTNKSFKIQVIWEPTEIKPNQIVRFDIKFMNYITNQPVGDVYYDFVVTKDEQVIKELRRSFAIDGTATHTVEFPSSGSFSVMVNVLGISGFGEQQNERVSFDVKVVPEFPLSSIIVMVSVVGLMIALTRLTTISKKRDNMT
jgi:hypothetical protein